MLPEYVHRNLEGIPEQAASGVSASKSWSRFANVDIWKHFPDAQCSEFKIKFLMSVTGQGSQVPPRLRNAPQLCTAMQGSGVLPPPVAFLKTLLSSHLLNHNPAWAEGKLKVPQPMGKLQQAEGTGWVIVPCLLLVFIPSEHMAAAGRKVKPGTKASMFQSVQSHRSLFKLLSWSQEASPAFNTLHKYPQVLRIPKVWSSVLGTSNTESKCGSKIASKYWMKQRERDIQKYIQK